MRSFGLAAAALALLGWIGCATATGDFGEGGAGGVGTGTLGNGGQGGGSTNQTGVTTSVGSTTSGSTTTTTTTTSTTGGGAAPGTLLISEYVEGSGNNKALELYNAGPTPIPLADCTVTHYQNGGTSGQPAHALPNVSLASGDVFVVCHTSFASLGLCDQSSASIQHSGNDAIVIACGGQTKDVFGRLGQDQVWGSAPTSSQDATLRRNCSVLAGDTTTSDNFDPATEWTGQPVDTFNGLGSHFCN